MSCFVPFKIYNRFRFSATILLYNVRNENKIVKVNQILPSVSGLVLQNPVAVAFGEPVLLTARGQTVDQLLALAAFELRRRLRRVILEVGVEAVGI